MNMQSVRGHNDDDTLDTADLIGCSCSRQARRGQPGVGCVTCPLHLEGLQSTFRGREIFSQLRYPRLRDMMMQCLSLLEEARSTSWKAVLTPIESNILLSLRSKHAAETCPAYPVTTTTTTTITTKYHICDFGEMMCSRQSVSVRRYWKKRVCDDYFYRFRVALFVDPPYDNSEDLHPSPVNFLRPQSRPTTDPDDQYFGCAYAAHCRSVR